MRKFSILSASKSRQLTPSHSRLKAAKLCCLLALSAPVAALAQQPTDSVPKLQGSALDYMLQRPSVTKHYENKKFGDHLFVDMGGGLNVIGQRNFKPGITAEASIGDWITPEHGVRIGLGGNIYRQGDGKTKTLDLSLDYLMNITAVANRFYPEQKPFEVWGVAGIDAIYSRKNGENEKGLGFHVGLRGKYNFSPYTYIYVEPKAGLLQDDVTFAHTSRGARPVGSVTLGLGYQLLANGRRAHNYGEGGFNDFGHNLNGFFVSVMGGGSFLLNAHPSTWKDNAGARAAVSVGKWFTPYHALRLSANISGMKQSGASKVKSIGGQLEYMTNLHNVFGGVNVNRHWWVNGLAGLSINGASSGNGRKAVLGIGGGLQGNVRLAQGLTFNLEPRIDFYQKDYAMHHSTVSGYDFVPSLLAGFTYTYNATEMHARQTDEPFESLAWHSHSFIETAAGLNLNVTSSNIRHPKHSLRPQLYLGLGKWFTPLHGVRLWTQAATTRYTPSSSLRHMEVGVDYLFNFTNALVGYTPDRKLELTGGLGMNLSSRANSTKVFYGLDASLRGTWYPNSFLGIFIEPKLQGYGKNYLPSEVGKGNIDFIASGMAGVQFNLRNYNRQMAEAAVEEDGGLRSSLSVAGGFLVPIKSPRSKNAYRGTGRLSYTQWFSPLSAWRGNLQMGLGKLNEAKYGFAEVGVDYLADLTAYTYGYDPDRICTVSALAGVNLGADYSSKKVYFNGDVHVGGQLAFRVAPNLKLYGEPQIGYHFSKRYNHDRLARWQMVGLVGLDYSFNRTGNLKTISAPTYKRYASVSVGTGSTSRNCSQSPRRYRWVMQEALTYGQWLSGLQGFEVGLSNTTIPRHGQYNENITSVRANYMLNLCSAITGESTNDKRFQLSGLAGLSLNVASRQGQDTKVVPGVQFALQGGYRVTPRVELFLQPDLAIYSSKINATDNSHPIDGQMTLSVGTKFNF